MFEPIRDVLLREPRIACALVFGTTARGAAHAYSDVDVAIGTSAPLACTSSAR